MTTVWRYLAPFAAVSRWPVRRWWVVLGASALVAAVIAVPTAMVQNPLFVRMTPPTWWSWPVLAATALLGGLLTATYVRTGDGATQVGRSGAAGGVLGWLEVGCPVCNKLVVLVVGVSGALRFWAPVQPALAVASVALLGWALYRRLRGELTCRLVPAGAAGR